MYYTFMSTGLIVTICIAVVAYIYFTLQLNAIESRLNTLENDLNEIMEKFGIKEAMKVRREDEYLARQAKNGKN